MHTETTRTIQKSSSLLKRSAGVADPQMLVHESLELDVIIAKSFRANSWIRSVSGVDFLISFVLFPVLANSPFDSTCQLLNWPDRFKLAVPVHDSQCVVSGSSFVFQ